jgi:riboflavin transporter FmnP
LQYDFGDVPPLLATFAMGPIAGLVSELVKCVIFFLSGKDEAGLVGTAANFVAGGALVVAAGIVYAKIHSLKGSLLALAIGTAVMVLVTSAANIYIFLPLWGIPADQIMPFILSATIPFNLAKGVLTSGVTFLFYKRVRGLLQ